MEYWGLNLLVFLTIMLLFYGLKAAFARPAAAGQAADERPLPLFFAVFAGEAALLGAWIAREDSPAGRRVSSLLSLAALPLSVQMIRGAQLLSMLMVSAVAVCVAALLTPHGFNVFLALVIGSLMGWCGPVVWLRQKAESRQMSISKELPFAIDLITVSMQAGQEFGAAVRQVVKESRKSALAVEFAVMLKEVELGKSRIEALKNMAFRIQIDEFMGLVSAVQQGTEMGASITKTLQIQAEELRRIRYHRAERKAARAPSVMIMPMVLFILPSVFVIIFVPMLIRLNETGFSNYMGG